MKFLHFLLFLIFLSGNSNAQWIQLNGPKDTFGVQEIITRDSMILISASCGVFYSTNAGNLWQPVYPVPFNTSVVFHDTIFTGGIQYPGYPGAVIRKVSSNEGLWSFTTVYDNSGVCNDLNTDGQQLFAAISSDGYNGAECGFTWSSDGNNWYSYNDGLPKDSVFQWPGIYITVYNVYAVGNNQQYIYAGTGKGLYRSLKETFSWASMNNGLPLEKITAITSFDSLLVTAEGNVMYRSLNHGDTWTPVFTLAPGNRVNRLKIIHDTIFALTQTEGLYLSPDFGISWISANTGLPGLKTDCLAVFKDEYFLGGDFGIAKDLSQWISVNNNIICSDIRDLDQTEGSIAATEFGKVLISNDDGSTWQTVVSPDTLGMTWGINAMGNCYFFINNPGYPAPCKGYLSCNDGASWKMQSTIPNQGDPYLVRTEGNKIIISEDDVLLLSSDTGKTWSNISPPSGMICNNFNDILLQDNEIYVAGCWNAELIKSTDLGSDWFFCSAGLPNHEVYKLGYAPGILVAASYPSAYLSFNQGVSWQDGGNGLPENHYDLETKLRDFVYDGSLLFTCTDNQVFFSSDSGFNWSNITSGLPVLSVLWGGTLMVRNHFLYFGTNGFGIWKISTENLPVGMHEKNYKRDFILRPNPARDYIELLTKGKTNFITVDIFDMTGKMLLSVPYISGRVNISGFLPGIYIVRVKVRGESYIYKKFVKIN